MSRADTWVSAPGCSLLDTTYPNGLSVRRLIDDIALSSAYFRI
jgi:hypothetical protein